MKIYLLHCKALKERISDIMNRLLACETVEDIEIITSETSEVKFSTTEENKNTLPEGWPMQLTTQLERSVYHKHFRAFGKIAEGGEPAILLEDDAIFDPKRFDEFVRECSEMPDDLHWCFFGTGLNMTIPGKGFVKNTAKLKSKCADSMLIHNEAAKIVYDDLADDRVYAAIDWDLNYRFLKHNLNVYWYEPGIVVQGSENGTYQCSHQR
jgi:GR25 family glycosyltransferase involved in LPS biosynthesis